MKFTLFVTQQCNLRCTYCYIDKHQETMTVSVAKKVVDFIFKKSIIGQEEINIGFFGGEPLLEFELIKEITSLIQNHPFYHNVKVNLSVVTNGTIFSDDIAEFINENDVSFGISCDGPPMIQDQFRVLVSGNKTSDIVEKNIRRAKKALPNVMVNAVYKPETLKYLPETVAYFSSLGIKQIYLNPDFSAAWTKADAEALPGVYDQVGQLYSKYYRQDNSHFISLIDSKITVILRNGYGESERCRMGDAEFAFTPKGNIYPCERLVGNGQNDHCIGSVFEGVDQVHMSCHKAADGEMNTACMSCGLKDYCMNWCGCSNYMASGYYNRVSPFMCASEKAAIQTSFNVFQTLERELGPTFYEHAAGKLMTNSLSEHYN
ncbi:MAG: radical SAM protein [Saprospiraceae bacterium]|nr:radical SAM protein [Saprospiraceae bacterium]